MLRRRRAPPRALRRRGRSALDLRVVVHDAEDLPAAVAVAGQRGVAVDPVPHVAAAVHEPADAAAAAAVPRAVVVRLAVVLLRGDLADARARRRWKWVSVRVEQEVALRVDRPALRVDQAAEVVDRAAVRGAQW